MRVRAVISALFLSAFLLLFLSPVPARGEAQITDPHVEYRFGEDVVFTARLKTDKPVDTVSVFFQSEGVSRTQVEEVTVTRQEAGLYELRYGFNVAGSLLRAFSVVEFHFEGTLIGGEPFASPPYQFSYDDNRFSWNNLEEKPFRVYWYEGDLSFAQNVLDVAQEGLKRIQTLLPLPVPDTVDIYIYSTTADMQAVLAPASESWVAGHADPDLSIMVVSLPSGPEQNFLTEQRIPHELLHILLDQSLADSHSTLPTWLSEGLASTAELYPNPDYQLLLNNAYTRKSLLSMAQLCQPFPRDASGALLAYAQSASFTRYLHSRFGSPGMQALVNSYADGMDCEQAPLTALDLPLRRLERDWRQAEFSENAVTNAMTNLLPWAALLIFAVGAPLVVSMVYLRRPVEQID